MRPDSVEWFALNPPPHAMTPRAPESVEVLASSGPYRSHVDVGWLETSFTDETALHRLRTEAGVRGCDAIFVDLTAAATGMHGNVDPVRFLRGTCVVYR